jgi:hypothetical protein
VYDGRKASSIDLRAESKWLHLSYRVSIGGDWEDVAETVRIVRVLCRFGGGRPYFICPGMVDGIACGRRVAKLYGAGCYFSCRHCYCLSYASQGESVWYRKLRRANKIKQRLAGSGGITEPFPPKPKGMWWWTYERLQQQALEAELLAEQAFAVRFEWLRGRVEEEISIGGGNDLD